MPIYINDIIENLAPAPTIRGSQNQVTGWLYAEVGGTAANGWNLIAAFRDTKSSVVSGTSVYIFTGSDTTDGQWQNASNWSEVSGSGGGGGIPEAPIDNQKYAREDAAWVVVTDGTQGEQGIQGVPGTDGIDGTDGSQGIQGVPGADGTDGAQGIPGTDGTNGTNGTSATATAGTTTTLLAGSNALVTNAGTVNDAVFDFSIPQGAQGIQGDNGVKGDTGDQGDQGIQGEQGLAGDQGIQGVKGDTGDQGIQGDIGLTGDQGIQGIQGVKGDDGANGTDGDGWTSGAYTAGTGVVTFSSDDGLGFVTGDLRGANGTDGTDGR